MVEKLKQDMISAMKEHNRERLTVIRGIKASIDKEHIDKKREINDELLIEVVTHQVKLLNDSIKEFQKGNRDDLVEKALAELAVLKEYLPEPLTEDDVDKFIDEVFKKVNPTGMRDMGKVMNEVTPYVKGRFDMSIVSSKIKERLNN